MRQVAAVNVGFVLPQSTSNITPGTAFALSRTNIGNRIGLVPQ